MSTTNAATLTIGQCATLACLLEVSAPKPGNVHRGADFEDLKFDDFLVSSVAIAPAMESASEWGVGKTVFRAIKATRALVGTNTNLGTVLLLAPLAAAAREHSIRDGIGHVLNNLDAADAHAVYEAIRMAQPGSLGKSNSMDVHDDAPDDLIAAMTAASDRDLVARQFVNQFEQVFDMVVPTIVDGMSRGWNLTTSVIHSHVKMMAEFPDSLIARKCGEELARRSAIMARVVLDTADPATEDYQRALSDLDFWLRSDGHRRNPGTTADLIAAGLFVALRDALISTNQNR